MGDTGVPQPSPAAAEAERRKGAGARAGYVIFAVFLLAWIVLGGQAAYQHRWERFAAITVLTLLFLTVPTGVATKARRVLRDRVR
jgi:hypothetical protein